MPQIILNVIKPMQKANIPIEVENISPDNFMNKKIDEIKEFTIWRGNRELSLKEVFNIQGDDYLGKNVNEITVILKGDLNKYKRIGQKMSGGEILIQGSIGMHLGFQMSGGKIIVIGDADDFAGANMAGGMIHIKGNAGHYLGGSIRGDWRGMSEGSITVDGNVGNECGVWMRDGLLEIGGKANMFLGIHMHQGEIIVQGDVEERVGAEMTGGVIVVKGFVRKLLPSFEYVGEVSEIPLERYGKIQGNFVEFHGDFAEKKQGKLFLALDKNKHLI